MRRAPRNPSLTATVTPFVDPFPDRPFVIRLIEEPSDELNFPNAWHTDLSYLEAPPALTQRHSLDVPDHGGDILFSNQYRAFETLSAGVQETLRGLRPCTRPAWPTAPAPTGTTAAPSTRP